MIISEKAIAAIKWAASFAAIAAVVVRSIGDPNFIWLDVILSLLGALGWLVVGLAWRDRALILLNGVLSLVLLLGAIGQIISFIR